MEIYEFIKIGVNALEILAFCIAFLMLVKFQVNSKIVTIFSILLLTIIVEFASSYLFSLYNKGSIEMKSSWGIYNVYNILVYTLWLYLYSLLLKGRQRVFCFIAIGIYLIIVFIESNFFLDYSMFLQSAAHVAGSLLISIVVVLYFIDILKEGSVDKLMDNPFFWISSGLLFYYVVNIPFRVVQNIYMFTEQASYLIFCLKLIFAFFMYLLICIGLCKFPKMQ